MICDKLEQLSDYAGLKTDISGVLQFLLEPGLAGLAPGKYPIKGDKIFAMVQCHSQKGRAMARLEAHRKFIDVHYVISGSEAIGHSLLTDKIKAAGPYDHDKDIQFFLGKPRNWLTLAPGNFALFLPQDLHAPLSGRGILKKIVIKIMI